MAGKSFHFRQPSCRSSDASARWLASLCDDDCLPTREDRKASGWVPEARPTSSYRQFIVRFSQVGFFGWLNPTTPSEYCRSIVNISPPLPRPVGKKCSVAFGPEKCQPPPKKCEQGRPYTRPSKRPRNSGCRCGVRQSRRLTKHPPG